MVRIIAAFVETPYYVLTIAPVIFVAIFWFALHHEKTLLLPFIGSTALVIGASITLGYLPIFYISLPTLMIGFTIHFFLATLLSYPIRKLVYVALSRLPIRTR